MEQEKTIPQMTFTQALKSTLSKLTDCKGRARRSEFWWSMLVFIIIQIAVSMAFNTQSLSVIVTADGTVSTLLYLLMLSVTIRRLHDTGRSGWWVIASYIVQIASTIYSIIVIGDIDMQENPQELMKYAFSPESMILMILSFIFTITIFVFCLMDSHPEENKYGPSPKYN